MELAHDNKMPSTAISMVGSGPAIGYLVGIGPTVDSPVEAADTCRVDIVDVVDTGLVYTPGEAGEAGAGQVGTPGEADIDQACIPDEVDSGSDGG